jgi:hypothetical protein
LYAEVNLESDQKVVQRLKAAGPMTNSNRIRFKNFWPGFDSRANIFVASLQQQHMDNPTEIVSVFVSPWRTFLNRVLGRIRPQPLLVEPSRVPRKPSSKRRVWYTGENIRPPYGGAYDAFISFDQDDYNGKNTYFPLLYSTVLFDSPENVSRRGIPVGDPHSLTRERNQSVNKTKFACVFIGNPEPTRLRAVEELQLFGNVDVFGPTVGNRVPSKFPLAKDYKFMLCFENDLFPGYITEKLLDAYLCGTVPLYWGDLGRDPLVNPRAFINLKDFKSVGEFAKKVGNMRDEEYSEIFKEPLLLRVPSLDPLKNAIIGPPRV